MRCFSVNIKKLYFFKKNVLTSLSNSVKTYFIN